MDATTQILIVINQSTNLELKNHFGAGMNVKTLTHSQQQPQAPNAHKKKPTIRRTTRVTMLCPPPPPPKGPFFTGSWSQLRSSARHTPSNQQAQVKQLETC